MIATASRRKDCDVLILTRGGGSLEDLWAFNEEIVARALHDCSLPVVSAVGHEVDFTIADFVADQRAATPSAAAELVSPEQSEWLAQLHALQVRANRQLQQQLSDTRQRLNWFQQRLQFRHPGQYLRQQAQRLDELEQRSRMAIRSYFNKLRSYLDAETAALKHTAPSYRISRSELELQALTQRLRTTMNTLLQTRQRQWAVVCKSLDTLSPLATLDRGYAIVTRQADNHILHRADSVTPGESVSARLAQGQLLCTVDKIVK
jgi:exodeoxyribonuclease VII large subunit